MLSPKGLPPLPLLTVVVTKDAKPEPLTATFGAKPVPLTATFGVKPEPLTAASGTVNAACAADGCMVSPP
jgi:hypothetical protein